MVYTCGGFPGKSLELVMLILLKFWRLIRESRLTLIYSFFAALVWLCCCWVYTTYHGPFNSAQGTCNHTCSLGAYQFQTLSNYCKPLKSSECFFGINWRAAVNISFSPSPLGSLEILHHQGALLPILYDSLQHESPEMNCDTCKLFFNESLQHVWSLGRWSFHYAITSFYIEWAVSFNNRHLVLAIMACKYHWALVFRTLTLPYLIVISRIRNWPQFDFIHRSTRLGEGLELVPTTYWPTSN